MKCVGYLRVSTAGQAEEGVSLDAQEAKIKAWADLNGYNQTEMYIDAGISGKRADNRPGLQAALRSLKSGDALIVYSLSRLARSTKDTIEIAEQLQKRGADLVSISEKIDTTTAAGKMVFRMLAVLNEFERDQVSERTKVALAHKKSRGEKTGGDVPFGYDLVEDGKNLIPNLNEQKALGLMKELRDKGYSLRAIGARLEAEGYKTKRGSMTWHPQVVNQILMRAA